MNSKNLIISVLILLTITITVSGVTLVSTDIKPTNEISAINLKNNSIHYLSKIIKEKQVNEFYENYQINPAICTISNDSFVIAWQSQGQYGLGYSIVIKIFNATTGVNVSNEIIVSEELSTGSQWEPTICALSEEIFVIAWHGNYVGGNGTEIYAKIYNATSQTNMTSEFQVNNNTAYDQQNPSMCRISDEIFVIAWDSLDDIAGEGDADVFARTFNATTGIAITEEFLINNQTLADQNRPSICSLSGNLFAAAWQDSIPTLYDISFSIFDAFTGQNVTEEHFINDYTDSAQLKPSVCALSSDKIVVGWQSDGQDESGFGIYAKVLNTTTGENITSEFRLNSYTENDQQYISLCRLSEETFLGVWDSIGQDSDSGGCFGSIFNATTGVNITSEFQVNIHVNGTQSFPVACAFSNDSYAISWHGADDQDGDGLGVFVSTYGTSSYPNVECVPIDDISDPLVINASITDELSSIVSVKAMINASIPLNLTMSHEIGDYWSCTWENISLYPNEYYRITIWACNEFYNINQTQFIDILVNFPSFPKVNIVPILQITEPLVINASITDDHSNIVSAKVLINASIPFNLTMSHDIGNYWTCSWENISLYPNGHYRIGIWTINEYSNINQTQYIDILISDDNSNNNGNSNNNIIGIDSTLIVIMIVGGAIFIPIMRFKLKKKRSSL